MTTDCTSDEFYKRMKLEGVKNQVSRDVQQLPQSNCDTYQEIYNFDDFEQEVKRQLKMTTISNLRKPSFY